MKRQRFISPRIARKNFEDKELPSRHGDEFEPKTLRLTIVKKTATVYKGWNKFFIKKRDAAFYEAKMILKSCCNCRHERSGYGDVNYEPCRYHAMSSEKWLRLRDRIANKLLKEWK